MHGSSPPVTLRHTFDEIYAITGFYFASLPQFQQKNVQHLFLKKLRTANPDLFCRHFDTGELQLELLKDIKIKDLYCESCGK